MTPTLVDAGDGSLGPCCGTWLVLRTDARSMVPNGLDKETRHPAVQVGVGVGVKLGRLSAGAPMSAAAGLVDDDRLCAAAASCRSCSQADTQAYSGDPR